MGYIPTMINPLLDYSYSKPGETTESGRENNLTGVNRIIVPFVACGDLSGWDSDMNYPLEVCI